jgi:hypothetical protein
MKSVPWTARIFNWPGMSAGGDTKQEALEQLRKKFDNFRTSKPSLPRPGSKVPIEFAATERVAQHEELSKDFIKRVIGVDWAWISDESSLADFHTDETDKRLTDKILEVYGVDVSDISSGNLSDIFDRIRGKAPKTELSES